MRFEAVAGRQVPVETNRSTYDSLVFSRFEMEMQTWTDQDLKYSGYQQLYLTQEVSTPSFLPKD